MSSSTVSLTPNPAATSRRRAVEKTSTPLNDAVLAAPSQTPDIDPPTTLRVEIRDRERDAVVKKPIPNTSANRRPTSSGRKPTKPARSKWFTVFRILTKNLVMLFIIGGVVQLVRKLSGSSGYVKSGDGIAVIQGDWEGKFAEMDSFMKKTSKMIQVQVDVIDRKLDKHIESVKGEMGRRDVDFDKKLSQVRQSLEKQLGEKLETLLSKEEFEGFLEEYVKLKGKDGENDGVNLDDVRVYAREIVEKEIERHAADGLGRVDYALASGGSRVVKHSEPYVLKRGGALYSMLGMGSVHPDAEKMLTPSFGEPGKCFPLKGSSGYVTIRLRTAIVPEAVTLEHVDKSVAYDRSSAPKDCRISGWRAQVEDSGDVAAENEKMVLLSEFTYNLGERNTQTFKVLESSGSNVVDTIRLDFISNHGSLSHTCIYRLRVHGHEPSLSMLAAEP